MENTLKELIEGSAAIFMIDRAGGNFGYPLSININEMQKAVRISINDEAQRQGLVQRGQSLHNAVAEGVKEFIGSLGYERARYGPAQRYELSLQKWIALSK